MGVYRAQVAASLYFSRLGSLGCHPYVIFLESTEKIQKAWYPQELTSPSQNKCFSVKIRFCKDKLTNLEILILPKYVHVTVIYIRIHFISKKIIYHDMIILYDFGFIF